MAMDKIVPLGYVVDTDPVPVDIIDASGWFRTETMEYSDDGRQDLLGWYLAQGWLIASYDLLEWYRDTDTDGNVTSQRFHKVYQLHRRKLQAERALNDLISDFTTAYNNGRTINDTRYDEILNIYNVGLDETEDEFNAVTTAVDSYDSTVNAIVDLLLPDFATYEAAVDILDDYGTDERARINLQFDNELTKATAMLISRGLNNTTVNTSTSAGIEEARTRSLNNFEDTLTERTLVNENRTYQAKRDMRSAVMASHERLIMAKRENANFATEARNRILSAMLDFMERRSDEYPSLEAVGSLAANIGFTDAGASVIP